MPSLCFLVINLLSCVFPVGEVLGFENLVFSIFEFVHALLENSKFKSTVRKALPELIYYVILYMQITEEQVKRLREAPGSSLWEVQLECEIEVKRAIHS